MKNIFFTLLIFLLGIVGFAQNNKKETLFTINDKPYYTDDFSRVYKKNLNLVKDDSQKNLDNYLDLYVGYKLKVAKAKQLGLDNEDKYKAELKSYRTQLAKNYLNDSKVTDELVNEAYNRTTEEVKASHILILVEQNATPADTLKAYNKLVTIKNKIDKGADFSEMAYQFSEDPSAKNNKGDLGYFSVFKMVYPFENAAYTTPVGKVSNIFRTRFGYHILKVEDKRENRGDVQVKHIMLLLPKGADKATADKVEQNIIDISKKIKQGESFEELAKQLSDDKSTASKGGLLQRFSSGELTSKEFEDVAFSLRKPEEVSEPFQSQFGWHIIKLVNRYPIKSFEDSKIELENRIKNDVRSVKITNFLHEKLRKKYSVQRNNELYNAIAKTVTDSVYSNKWKQPQNVKPFETTLLTINTDKKVSGVAFLQYIAAQQKGKLQTKPVGNLVAELYENFVNNELVTYYDDNLETEFPEFHYVMEEYRDGLLLFDLMEKQIWDKAKNDSIGLQQFYNTNKNKYMWKNRYKLDIYSSTDKAAIEKARKYLKKGKSIDYIKEKLNTNDKITIITKSGQFEEDYEAIPELQIKKKGITDVAQKGNYYFVANVAEVLPSQPKTIDECKGKLVSDYQQYLEENWVSDLKKEFNVNINTAVFEKVKKELQL
ncbi:peptidylprolyl isomerase [Flavobacterium sp.]|uniref:peptidylprolyl isomerase n=1 Tax=Flavobacterium sp. TaxID=239 RepID=UPI003527B88B